MNKPFANCNIKCKNNGLDIHVISLLFTYFDQKACLDKGTKEAEVFKDSL